MYCTIPLILENGNVAVYNNQNGTAATSTGMCDDVTGPTSAQHISTTWSSSGKELS